MRHSALKDWYAITWGNAVNSSTGAIDGIRRDDVIMTSGSIVPRQWFNLVPAGRLDLIINQLNAFVEYVPDDDEALILYTVYPATKPPTRFAQRYDGRTKWYRVTNEAPIGVAALRSVDGVCKAGDVAKPGDVIPVQWMSALDFDQIVKLSTTGLLSDKWANERLNEDQRRQLYKRSQKPIITQIKPTAHELQVLYEQYPGVMPDNTEEKTEE